jgi:hypothetical protein
LGKLSLLKQNKGMDKNLEKYIEVAANRFKDMTASEKLNLSLQLNISARKLKKAALEYFYPQYTNIEVEERVKEIFFYART